MRCYLLLVSVLALILTGQAARAEYPDYTSAPLSVKASEYMGRITIVRCESLPQGVLGYTYIPSNEVWIETIFCNPLASLIGGYERWRERQGVGLMVLAHELTHIRFNSSSEAWTQCRALQQTDDLARVFGARESYIPALQAAAVRLHYFYFNGRLKAYSNPRKCRPNGAWDQTPGDGRWP